MPDKKRFGLNSPRELLAKLDWEMEQCDQLPVPEERVASYRAFNCAVTAWSICDWVWNAAGPELQAQFRAASPFPHSQGSEPLAALVRKESRELAVCQQLANGSKHFIRKQHNDPEVSSERLQSVSLFVSGDGRQQRAIRDFGVFIRDGARTYSDVGLFSRAQKFWHEFFERHQIG